MKQHAQRHIATVLVLLLGAALSGCGTPARPETETPLESCGDILPGKMAQDIFGRSAEVVQLHDNEPDAVDPLVDKMIADGIACGGSVDGAVMMDGAVFLGQLAMDESEWTATRARFVADGHEAADELFNGWVYVSKSSDDPTLGSGFVWRDGVLYYAQTPFALAFLPSFASEFAGDAPAGDAPVG